MDPAAPTTAQPHQRSPRPGFRLLSRLRNFSRRLSCTSPPRLESDGNSARAAQSQTRPVEDPPRPTETETETPSPPQPNLPINSQETRRQNDEHVSPSDDAAAPVIPLAETPSSPLPVLQSPAPRPRRTQSSNNRRPFRPSTIARLRRKCHKCDSPFIFSERTCQECDHVICPDCPWDSAASLHTTILPPTLDPVSIPEAAVATSDTVAASRDTSTPAVILDAPPGTLSTPPPDLIPSTFNDTASSSDDSSTATSEYDSDYSSLPFRRTANLQARTHKRPRMRVRHICHQCNGQFAIGLTGTTAACATCQHDRCTDCQRTPEKRLRVQREFEAEVVAVVRARLEGYGVRDVPAVVPVGPPVDRIEVVEA